MSSNLPPDWRGEEREHYRDCATRCDERDNPQCIEHGDEHYCTCREIHERDMDNLAEAAADFYWGNIPDD